jgi:hypothetical protein
MALLGAGASASAATTPVATITVPNITVKSMQNVNVYGTLTNPSVTGASGGGYWQMAQNVNSAVAGAWWLYKGHVTDSATGFTPGSDALGTYHAYPEGATDNGGKTIGQNEATFYIREASKTALKVTRSGSALTILAGATYYNTKLDGGSMGAWVPYAGQKVTIYLMAGGKWKAWKSYATGKNGNITAFTVQSAAKQKFYAATADGNIVWGNASPAVTK